MEWKEVMFSFVFNQLDGAKKDYVTADSLCSFNLKKKKLMGNRQLGHNSISAILL